MLTNKQNALMDTWLVRLNQAARAKNPKHHRVKRNHFIQTVIEAMEDAGYNLAQFESLESLKHDLVQRLTRIATQPHTT
jgi:hypothetical protein